MILVDCLVSGDHLVLVECDHALGDVEGTVGEATEDGREQEELWQRVLGQKEDGEDLGQSEESWVLDDMQELVLYAAGESWRLSSFGHFEY